MIRAISTTVSIMPDGKKSGICLADTEKYTIFVS